MDREDLYQELTVHGTPSELVSSIASWAAGKYFHISKYPLPKSSGDQIWLEIKSPYYLPNQTIGSIALQAMPNQRTKLRIYKGGVLHWKTGAMAASSHLAELCIQMKAWLEQRGCLEAFTIKGKTHGPLVR